MTTIDKVKASKANKILQDYENKNHVIFRDQKEAIELIAFITSKAEVSTDKPGIMARLEREGWRSLTKERDNWKVKALAYREIIRRLKNETNYNKECGCPTCRIVSEADKVEDNNER